MSLSTGLFSIAFEILRERALEGVLDSKSLLEQIRLAAWFIGVAAGAFLFGAGIVTAMRCKQQGSNDGSYPASSPPARLISVIC